MSGLDSRYEPHGLPFEGDPATMLDSLASLARTALDDPAALDLPYRDGVNDYDPAVAPSYAVGKLDEIIEALNPSYETRETFAATLTILGRHLAERADVIREVDADEESGEKEAYELAASLVNEALDKLDEAIDSLTSGPTEEGSA